MLNSHDLADRQVLAAIREYDDLSRRRYKITKLDQPVQRGWRRLYALSEDAVRRRDRSILEAILVVIGSVQLHRSRDFRARRGRRRKLVEIEQPLRPIPIHEWQRENYPSEWHGYFHYELLLEWNDHWQPYWVFKQPSLYTLKIERNWLWYFREVDPAIETRLSELDRWLEARHGRERYGWLKGWPQHYYWGSENIGRERSLEREHRRDIARALKNFPEVEPAASVRCSRFSFRPGIFEFFPGVAQQQRHSAQNGASAGANPAAGTILRRFAHALALVAQKQRRRT